MVSVTSSDSSADTLAKSGSPPQTDCSAGSHSTPRLTEDWLAVCIGVLVFVLSLTLLFGVDSLGWGITTSVWLDPAKALKPASKAYANLPAFLPW